MHSTGRGTTTVLATWISRLLNTPGRLAFLAFVAVYFLLIRYCAYAYFRDPSSAFFDPSRGYDRLYSLQRQVEADHFLLNSSLWSLPKTHPYRPKLCIGIATIARDGEQYIRSTVGSLLAGLKDTEREEIHIAILIAHTTPHDHPLYSEAWPEALADSLLFYNVSQQRFAELELMAKEKNFAKKGIFDYTYVLQHCLDSGADWIAMVEDDTLAVEGWYPHTIKALEKADDQHRHDSGSDWLYLRLFFTEEFLGWNSEESLDYILLSLGLTSIITILLLFTRRWIFAKFLTNSVIVTQGFICTPALIALYFAAGRLSMHPLRDGVYEMPEFGCCAQGLVFSHEMTPRIIDHLIRTGEGFVDQILEAWANEHGLMRWMVVPSLLQHIGGHSSKGDDFGEKAVWGRSVAEKIWNFGFELYGSDG